MNSGSPEEVTLFQTVRTHFLLRTDAGVFTHGNILVPSNKTPQALPDIFRRWVVDDSPPFCMFDAQKPHGPLLSGKLYVLVECTLVSVMSSDPRALVTGSSSSSKSRVADSNILHCQSQRKGLHPQAKEFLYLVFTRDG